MARKIAGICLENGTVPYLADTMKNVDVIRKMLNDFAGRAVDAIVLEVTAWVTLDDDIQKKLKSFPAAVVVAPEERDLDLDLIIHDRSSGIREAVEHFFITGRKKPGIALAVQRGKGKLDPFLEQLATHGVEIDPEAIIDIREEEACGTHCYEALRCRFPDGKVPFDSLFCPADEIAMAAVCWFNSVGIRVPEDVAIVGFNDSDGAKFFDPPLASVQRKDDEVAQAIEKMLFARLRNPSLARQRRHIPHAVRATPVVRIVKSLQQHGHRTGIYRRLLNIGIRCRLVKGAGLSGPVQ